MPLAPRSLRSSLLNVIVSDRLKEPWRWTDTAATPSVSSVTSSSSSDTASESVGFPTAPSLSESVGLATPFREPSLSVSSVTSSSSSDTASESVGFLIARPSVNSEGLGFLIGMAEKFGVIAGHP